MMDVRKMATYLVVAVVLFSLRPNHLEAATPLVGDGQDYMVQADDWLGTLADKFYGSPLAYPVIVEATNAKSAEDERYAPIGDPGQVSIGQLLFVPALVDVPDELLADAPLSRDGAATESTAAQQGPTEEQARLLASLDVKGTPPELFNEVWLNSDPLKLANLQGQVVIVEFWTFG